MHAQDNSGKSQFTRWLRSDQMCFSVLSYTCVSTRHIFSRAGNSFLFFSGFLEVVGPLVVYFLSVVRRRLVRVAMEFFSWTIFYQI